MKRHFLASLELNMKRTNNLYNSLCEYDVIKQAIIDASKHKKKQHYVQIVLKNIDNYTKILQNMLLNESYEPSKFVIQIIHSYDKDRVIKKVPFFPDRCIHHCIANIMLPKWNNIIGNNTFGSWKERGINSNNKQFSINHRIKKIISSYKQNEKVYCLKIDIKKCYDNVNIDIMYKIISKWCKDRKMLSLIKKILYVSERGLPIGSYLSQLFINLYLTIIDRYIENILKLKFVRYMDDIAVFSNDKKELHTSMHRIQNFLFYELDMELNSKRQIFLISDSKYGRSLDMCGYRFYRGFTLLRKRIKNNIIKHIKNNKSISSYYGWLYCCDSKNFQKVYNI